MRVRVRYDLTSRFRRAFGRVRDVEAETVEDAIAQVRKDEASNKDERDATGDTPTIVMLQATVIDRSGRTLEPQ
tara:strand:- start:31 stop:252 length:222 start_codon:yes stop_codon:yes gene_type:complete